MVCLVTGANRGIGFELTKQLLSRGDTVLATVRSAATAEDLRNLASNYPDYCFLIELDVADETTFEHLQPILDDEFHLDLLINNAGVGEDFDSRVAEADLEKVEMMLEVNAVGPLRMVQYVLPQLKNSDRPKIVNITSQMGSIADNRSGSALGYRMSKAALNMLTKCLAVDEPKICTASIHPGWVRTAMGGKNASVSPSESASGILHVIDNLELSDSGQFLNYQGDAIPW